MDNLMQNHLFATHAIAAVGFATFGTAFTYPLDTIKTLVQVSSGSSSKLTAFQILNKVQSLSGNSVGREGNHVHVSEALMAGMAAGAMESLISSPFELIKLRAQEHPWMMTGSGKPSSVYEVRMPSEIISLEGWGAFWRGLHSGVVRDTIFGGMFFSTWQFLPQVMLGWKAAGMDHLPSSDEKIGPLSPLVVSLAAGFSGSVVAASSHGFGTCQMSITVHCAAQDMAIVTGKYIVMERKL
ncbi:hypothetical protein SLEP1_g38274 [Rubroshorea leprosula]|uniref:Uncharacterized protein n=1 Tax=Rubroshorea leprosula TaxID=152421 RepID=A0AAV5KXD6_9ROSI|nr:hypothetical protein SLEP1_g38274 [Rubroshorea leprosula]